MLNDNQSVTPMNLRSADGKQQLVIDIFNGRGSFAVFDRDNKGGGGGRPSLKRMILDEAFQMLINHADAVLKSDTAIAKYVFSSRWDKDAKKAVFDYALKMQKDDGGLFWLGVETKENNQSVSAKFLFKSTLMPSESSDPMTDQENSRRSLMQFKNWAERVGIFLLVRTKRDGGGGGGGGGNDSGSGTDYF